MAYSKKTWKARQGLGLNKFSIDGATPVAIINQPDSVTQQGDALSAGNLNNLEDRIAEAFDDVENEKADKSEIEDLQSQINQHEARLSNLEQVSGDYVTSDMQDYSTTPTGKASYALVESLIGVSRVENQLVQNGNFVDSSGWYVTGGTIESVADNVITIKATDSTMYIGREGTFVVGHRYLWGATVKSSASLTAKFGDAYDIFGSFSLTANSWMQMLDSHSCNSASANRFRYYFYNCTVGDTVQIKQCFVRDLSLYFNGSIPSNAQTIAGIAQYYPELLVPRAYNAGEIVDSTYTKVTSRGANILEPMTQTTSNGTYSDGTYTNNTRAGAWAGKIDVSNIGVVTIACDSVNGEFSYGLSDDDVSGSANILGKCGASVGGTTKTVVTAGYNFLYMYFRTYTEGTTATLTKLRVNVGSTALAYSAYNATSTLPIPSVTLKGAGSVSDTLDVESGEITRRIGSYTFDGTETWTTNGSSKTTQALASVIKSVGTSVVPNILCPVLIPTTGQSLYNGSVASGIGQNDYGVRVGSNDVALLTGVTIYFELATPTTESVTPTLNNTLKTEGGGTVYSDADVDGQFTLGFLNL